MPRRNRPPRRQVVPDKKFQNVHIAMLINRMMRGGNKSTVQTIMYRALDIVEQRTKRDPVEVVEQALRNAAPTVEVKPKRVGGSTYQVPMEVPHDRSLSLAMRWILEYARGRGGRNMEEKLAAEIMDAAGGQGNTIKRKDDTHRMAEANRAFAHFR